MNVSAGGSDEGPYALLARVHPDIRRVELTTADGEIKNVPVYGSADFQEVRFAALLVPRDLRLDSVTGFSDGGEELERFDLAFHQEILGTSIDNEVASDMTAATAGWPDEARPRSIPACNERATSHGDGRSTTVLREHPYWHADLVRRRWAYPRRTARETRDPPPYVPWCWKWHATTL